MMKKTRILLLGFMIFGISSFSSIFEVRGAFYYLNVEDTTSFKLNVRSYGSLQIYTFDIEEIYSGATNWTITLIVKTLMSSSPYNITLQKDPSTATNCLDFYSKPEAICPLPVNDYLSSMAAAVGGNWSYNGTTLIYNNTATGILKLSTYDTTTGIITYYKYTSNGVAIVEASTYTPSEPEEPPFIPGYDLPLLIGFTAFISLGLIYVMKSRKKSEFK